MNNKTNIRVKTFWSKMSAAETLDQEVNRFVRDKNVISVEPHVLSENVSRDGAHNANVSYGTIYVVYTVIYEEKTSVL